MANILVRNVDEDIARRLKQMAAAERISLGEIARRALTAYVRPSKAEAWAAVDRIRSKIRKATGDSTKLIREDRDNDEPYR